MRSCCSRIKTLFLTGVLFYSLLAGSVSAQDRSAVGLDYLAITQNPLLAEVMQELEPGLLEIYQRRNMSEKRKFWGLRGIARALRDDEMYKPMLEDLEAVSRPALLKLARLPAESYPTLHQVVELVRLNIEYKEKTGVGWSKEEYESNMRLYQALHGKN
ncbi:hypothetical protein [Motiliproteus sp. MSK22-1]|uniref:hypothetical protein n=1 Tax=Motiliproteus sp. MSK22-1 TaxID=1897630 RepID=UPI000975E431|nr:hypothetical protein [Motiliproteus sp. MSK22-1]OMH28082.1 hypothetical protein BGP75_22205 [Motiliproteus sp. MSK22-1]